MKKFLLTICTILVITSFAYADNSKRINDLRQQQQQAQEQLIKIQQFLLITEGRIQELSEQDKAQENLKKVQSQAGVK